jgi:hypothetical protein
MSQTTAKPLAQRHCQLLSLPRMTTKVTGQTMKMIYRRSSLLLGIDVLAWRMI